MLKNIFKKKKTQEEVEKIIREEIERIKLSPEGKRNFSQLKNLEEEVFLNPSMDDIQNELFFDFLREAEDRMYSSVYDVQDVIDLLQDMTTLTFEPCAYQARKFLKHKKLFEKKPERIYSVLSPDEDIETQLEKIKLNSEKHKYDLIEYFKCNVAAGDAMREREEYDVNKLPERLSIMSNFMLYNISENTLQSAKNAILSSALSGELELYARGCVRGLHETYIMMRDKEFEPIPTTDVLIAEAIIKANGYNTSEFDFFDYKDIDLQKNIDIFVREYGDYIEMREQFKLLNKVYEHLVLDARVPEQTSNIGRTYDSKVWCIGCENKTVDKEKDAYFCNLHRCYVDSGDTCNQYKKRELTKQEIEGIMAFFQ